MLRILKFGASIFLGMLIAPTNGTKFRSDLGKYLTKFKPKLKVIINTIEESWSKAQDDKIEEIGANVEYKINKINSIAKNNKKTPYKTLKKVETTGSLIVNELKKSENAKKIAQELARVSISLIDGIASLTSKANVVSKNISVEATVKPKRKKAAKKNKND